MQRDKSTADSVPPGGAVLLYDGECGVCSRSVQWVLAHERQHTLRFAPLQSPLGKQLVAAAGVAPATDSVTWVETENDQVRAKVYSGAVFATLRYVGGPWRLLLVLQLVPRPLLDAAYRLFAKHRQKLVPKACLLPPPETRARFLDA